MRAVLEAHAATREARVATLEQAQSSLAAQADKAKALPADNLAQLAGFVRGLSAGCGQHLGSAPAHVKEIVKRCFTDFGWDVVANRALPTNTRAPTPEALVT